jgi:hypothetical protein
MRANPWLKGDGIDLNWQRHRPPTVGVFGILTPRSSGLDMPVLEGRCPERPKPPLRTNATLLLPAVLRASEQGSVGIERGLAR